MKRTRWHCAHRAARGRGRGVQLTLDAVLGRALPRRHRRLSPDRHRRNRRRRRPRGTPSHSPRRRPTPTCGASRSSSPNARCSRSRLVCPRTTCVPTDALECHLPTVVAPNADTLYAIAPLDLRGEPCAHRPRDPRPLLLVPIHLRLHRLVRLHRHPRHRWSGRALGHHAAGLEGQAARRHHPSPPPRRRCYCSAGSSRRRGRRGQRPRAWRPTSPSSPSRRSPALRRRPRHRFGGRRARPQAVARPASASSMSSATHWRSTRRPTARAAHVARFATLDIGPGRHPSTEVHDPASVPRCWRVSSGEAASRRERQGRARSTAGRRTNTRDLWARHAAAGRVATDRLGRERARRGGVRPRRDGLGRHAPWRTPLRLALRARRAAPGQRVLVGDPVRTRPFFWRTRSTASPSATAPRAWNTADGSLDLYIQHDPPAGHESNWLPAPAGAFVLVDAALPARPSVLEGATPIRLSWRSALRGAAPAHEQTRAEEH